MSVACCDSLFVAADNKVSFLRRDISCAWPCNGFREIASGIASNLRSMLDNERENFILCAPSLNGESGRIG